MAQKPRLPSMTAEQIKCILKEVLCAFDDPSNKAKMDEVHSRADTNLVKLMQYLIPTASGIQHKVIEAHGFASSDEGVLKFTQMVNFFAKDDPEVEVMAKELRTKFIPPMPTPPPFVSPVVS